MRSFLTTNKNKKEAFFLVFQGRVFLWLWRLALVDQDGLSLTACLSLLSAEVKGVCHFSPAGGKFLSPILDLHQKL